MYIEEVISSWRKGWRGKIKDEANIYIIDNEGIRFQQEMVIHGYLVPMTYLMNRTFEEVLPKPVDFITASNSGKLIKPKNNNTDNKYQPLQTWVGRMASGNTKGLYPLDFINDLWYVQED